MAESQREGGQVKPPVQELGGAATTEAVRPGARRWPARLGYELGGEASELASGHGLREIRVNGEGLPEPCPEVGKAVHKEAALVEWPGQSLDVRRPGGHGVGVGRIPREERGQPGGQGGEHCGVEVGQALQAVSDDGDQGRRADRSAGLVGGGGHLGRLASAIAVGFGPKNTDLRGIGVE